MIVLFGPLETGVGVVYIHSVSDALVGVDVVDDTSITDAAKARSSASLGLHRCRSPPASSSIAFQPTPHCMSDSDISLENISIMMVAI